MTKCPDCNSELIKVEKCCDDEDIGCHTTHFFIEPYYKCPKCKQEYELEDIEE